MKWTKFKDEKPEIADFIWVSDGRDVWPDAYTCCPDEFYWMDRINPAPPEIKFHFCSSEVDGYLSACHEADEKDRLILRVIYLKKEFIFSDVVKFCPFCGFTLEKK